MKRMSGPILTPPKADTAEPEPRAAVLPPKGTVIVHPRISAPLTKLIKMHLKIRRPPRHTPRRRRKRITKPQL